MLQIRSAEELKRFIAENRVCAVLVKSDVCAPCKVAIENSREFDIPVALLDFFEMDEEVERLLYFPIKVVPTFVLFIDGVPSARITGPADREEVNDTVNKAKTHLRNIRAETGARMLAFAKICNADIDIDFLKKKIRNPVLPCRAEIDICPCPDAALDLLEKGECKGGVFRRRG